MIVHQTPGFEKQYRRLHPKIQKKFQKQMTFLLKDPHYPSLYTKKMDSKVWEARVDFHYRFTFIMTDEEVFLRSIGMHDKGLGKK
ncbi:hypothetical protein A3D77_02090 [Candidatus Gottesmanbacteria bacterium RIFCSPHIGHO2_02_FULL_39_11]|uniref:Cytotoxin n=1 Tax=Candidatus Gottesmanbacteria bacterium RIFCSPHIGHO2_02_FULL_39_11 TaxID=1798382 RepID=A0A1F5ZUI2_9BACT|nr:MAG: hypothetical protein A3D77_02090 [Candidatus Gottesmanbacteria bacterium RIFCSPHIGHO2_02_FULL_39_11]